jgi:hypothetical protein
MHACLCARACSVDDGVQRLRQLRRRQAPPLAARAPRRRATRAAVLRRQQRAQARHAELEIKAVALRAAIL